MHEAHLHKPRVFELRTPRAEGKVPLELRVLVRELQLLGHPGHRQGLQEGDGRAQESWLGEGVLAEPGSVSCSCCDLRGCQMCTCGHGLDPAVQGWVCQPVTLLGTPDHRALVVSCSASLLKEKYRSRVSSIAVVEGNLSVCLWAEFGHQGKVTEDSIFCLCSKRG